MMWTLEIGTLAVCLSLGWLINAVLFTPHRVRPLYRLLYTHSAWYRRWIFKLMIHSMKRVSHSFAAMIPAAQRATDSFQKIAEAFARAPLRGPR